MTDKPRPSTEDWHALAVAAEEISRSGVYPLLDSALRACGYLAPNLKMKGLKAWVGSLDGRNSLCVVAKTKAEAIRLLSCVSLFSFNCYWSEVTDWWIHYHKLHGVGVWDVEHSAVAKRVNL